MRPRTPKNNGQFASGIALPIRVDGDGGLMLAQGDDYIRGAVLGTVLPNASENPFQDIGSNDDAIFENPADPLWRTAQRQRINRQMAVLTKANLAQLQDVQFMTGPAGEDGGDYHLSVTYRNLEARKDQVIKAPLVADPASPLGVAVRIRNFR